MEVKFREGLCKASVILVCLTPRYLTRPNCLRELQWALDLANKGEKDVRILPLHPALTFPAIQSILRHGCVCVAATNGAHAVHRLSAKALELLAKIKQYMCLRWSDLQPWASDVLGELWPEQVFAADGSVRASMVTGHAGGAAVGLVNELVSKIADKLCFNDQPSKVADCKELDDKDLESSAVADADVPVDLLDAYPELSPAFRQRAQDCSDASKLVADAISQHRNASSAPDSAAAAVVPAASQPAPAGAPAASAASLPAMVEGVFVKSKSNSFPSLSKQTRFVSIRAEGFKWFEVSPTGGQGDARGSVAWAQVRGAARVGEWKGKGLFGVEILHPGVEKDVTVLWCSSESERDEVVAAINRLIQK